MVKQAAADANHQLGHLNDTKHSAISEACARLIRGDFHDQFVVDMIQGGAGTSPESSVGAPPQYARAGSP
ncbi:aspartate ammonia-lyase [Pseudomonas syringae pv. persicae]|nr:aspartate ammonia-lyase [Pseudomonas syringae pv. persicae]